MKCSNCGDKFGRFDSNCPSCGQAKETQKAKPKNNKMTACGDCHAEISIKADKCPNCGFKEKPKTSVVTWVVCGFFALMLITAIGGGSGSNSSGGSSYSPPSISYSAADKVYACRAMIATNNAWGRTTPLLPFSDYKGKLLSKDKVDVTYFRGGKRWQYNCHIEDNGSNSQWSMYSHLNEAWSKWHSYIGLKRTKTKLTVTAKWSDGSKTIKHFNFPK